MLFRSDGKNLLMVRALVGDSTMTRVDIGAFGGRRKLVKNLSGVSSVRSQLLLSQVEVYLPVCQGVSPEF